MMKLPTHKKCYLSNCIFYSMRILQYLNVFFTIYTMRMPQLPRSYIVQEFISQINRGCQKQNQKSQINSYTFNLSWYQYIFLLKNVTYTPFILIHPYTSHELGREKRIGKRKCVCAGSTWSHIRFLCGCQMMYCHLRVSIYHNSLSRIFQEQHVSSCYIRAKISTSAGWK